MHISFEGGILEDPWREPDEEMFKLTVDPMKAPDEPEMSRSSLSGATQWL